MRTYQTGRFIIEVVAAVGTLAVAVLAIWGERIRSVLAPPSLAVEVHNITGDATELRDEGAAPGSGVRAMYYHLKVVNRRPWLPAWNCRVLLVGFLKRGTDNLFHPAPMPVPIQFAWAPAEMTPPLVTITREQVFDFGRVVEPQGAFWPVLYSYPNNFQGFVGPGEAVRYQIAVDATSFSPKRYHVFEVAWDGIWSHSPAEMQQHLFIREVKP